MSLHAEPSEEARARLAAQKRNSTISSAVIAGMTIVLICLGLGIVILPGLYMEPPTILIHSGEGKENGEREVSEAPSQVPRRPVAPESRVAPVIFDPRMSGLSFPPSDAGVETAALTFGEPEDWSGGWTAGRKTEAAGAEFFDQKVEADRIVYVIDFSGSMGGTRERLMRAELEKSISGLNTGCQYQLILFAGPAWIPGDKVEMKKDGLKSGGSVIDEAGKIHRWEGKGGSNWKQRGPLRKIGWNVSNGESIRESLDAIRATRLVFGTDWRSPLKMAMLMEPAPEVIYFMTDGLMRGTDMMELAGELGREARRKGIVINSIAMMEPDAEQAMAELALKTGGQFTVIANDGEAKVKEGGKR